MLMDKLTGIIRQKTRNLRGFLIYGAVVGTVIMLVLVYLGVSVGFQWYATKQASERVKETAGITANALLQLMEQGWRREELRTFLLASSAAYQEQHVTVTYYSKEDIDNDAFHPAVPKEQLRRDGVELIEREQVSFIYPQVAAEGCVRCHGDQDPGDIVGLLVVTEDLRPVLEVVRRDTILYLLFLFPFPILGAVVISRFLTGKIDHSLKELQARIQKVNRTDDLRILEINNIDLAFDEINVVYEELRALAAKLRNIAVDKDILEFEVRLLEKFIITSEVVKDWKEHVNKLITEINQIVDVPVIFSLFKVDTEDFILEIFWLSTPSPETRGLVEDVIRSQIKNSEVFNSQPPAGVHIYHNVAQEQEQLDELDEESFRFQTKSLFLDTPQIGGIVGIGVSSRLEPGSTRMLVIEGVLTTLLNVIGSVKAVYKYTKELEYFATRDPLTNLYTQRVFWELLEYEIGRATRRGYRFAVMVVDLDDFKLVNDIHGHLAGDKFLQEASHRIRECLRKDDILARYGGDEYAIILPYADQEQAFLVAQRINSVLQEFSLPLETGHKAKATASIGIAVFPDHAQKAKDLFLIADNMMYKAKALGKDQIGLPSHEDVLSIFKTIEDKHTLILQALEENKVNPHFQPIKHIATGQVEANEVLMRIDLPGHIMTAGDFIETAESMGIISKLDFLLIDKALARARQQNYKGYLFFNLSPKALIVSDFLLGIRGLVHKYGIDPHKIVFEITERDTVKNMTMLSRFVNELKREGFKFAIDDFGSGFSSFQYIKRLPIDFVKIEGEFIRNLSADAGMDRAIVMSIVTLARELGITTVAEFVEDAQVYQFVQELGIDYAQGFYIGRPSPQLFPAEPDAWMLGREAH